MAKNVIINGVIYSDVPRVDIPISGGGMANFYDTSDANAGQGDVLASKTAYGSAGAISGTMANNGSTSGTISAVAGSVSIPAGYTSGGTVAIASAEQQKIVSGNIKSGVTILGVSGASSVKDVSDGTTATASTVLSGYYFYNAGGTLTQGSVTLPVISQDSVTKVLSIT